MYDPVNLAVLRLISMTIEAGNKAGIPVAMCGEMAGDIRYTKLLLGLGLREFSVHPSMILEVRKVITETKVDEIEQAARALLNIHSQKDFAAAIEQLVPK